MDTLAGKSVFVVTKEGEPIAIGRFHIEGSPILEQGEQVELRFETEALACRMRIPVAKIPEIKNTWNGKWFNYVLAGSDAVWRGLPPNPVRELQDEELPQTADSGEDW